MRENFDLSKVSWFGVGGKAEFFYKVQEFSMLEEFLKTNTREITVISNASNILIRDGGIKGVTLKLGRDFTKLSRLSEEMIEVGSASLDKTFAMKMAEMEVSGFEFLSTIPGAIGGGIKMNCGCFGREIAEVLVAVKGMDLNGNKVYIPSSDIQFTYRNAIMPLDIIITSAICKGVPSSGKSILETMMINERKRSDSQPLKGKTCGSTFKNPPGAKAWELLVKSGANLLRKGGAYFSEKHANFILNRGNAKASDIEELGEEAIRLVKEKFGITLEWEVKRIGEY